MVATVFGVLASAAAIAFFVVIFSRATLFGFSADVYFMSAIMLVIIARGMKMCRCCKGHGMGYQCSGCGSAGEMPKMGM